MPPDLARQLVAEYAESAGRVPLITHAITRFGLNDRDSQPLRYRWNLPYQLPFITANAEKITADLLVRPTPRSPTNDVPAIHPPRPSPLSVGWIRALLGRDGRPQIGASAVQHIEGTDHWAARIDHERAHGLLHEGVALLPDFEERVYAAVGSAIGIPTIRGRYGDPAVRAAIQEQLGSYAAGVPAGGLLSIPVSFDWEELWACAVANRIWRPDRLTPIVLAIAPFVEEILDVAPAVKEHFVFAQLAGSSTDLGFLRVDYFPLFAAGLAGRGQVTDGDTVRALRAEAQQRGVELPFEYLRTTAAGPHLPRSYPGADAQMTI